jgi:outer membrane receptor protein involved in Fe transport
MIRAAAIDSPRLHPVLPRLALALGLCALSVHPALSAVIGKVQGRILSSGSSEPIGYALVALVPSDTTMKRVAGMTNADGTYLLEAAPGAYTLDIQAMSYVHTKIPNVVVTAGQLVTVNTALTLEAIQLHEVVVETRARHDTDASLLAARKKAITVGDAVGAEQVRKTPDKDAAEVLRRVTGLSVVDGKYVYVRGLGERYSSTELDGVRIVSPEPNKRVVPLDLLPANLLDNIVVQKTYTADRPGEFGGGDVQVRTRDFPGARTLSFTYRLSVVGGLTFHDRQTYAGSPADRFGFGADSRAIPGQVSDVAGDRTLIWSPGKPEFGFEKSTLAYLGRSFSNAWSAHPTNAAPNSFYAASYGDEFKLLGRPLGLIASWSFSRSFMERDESQRLFKSYTDTTYDYVVRRDDAYAQLGGVMAASYRLSPGHSLHLRGSYLNNADDEVQTYTGQDHNRIESVSGTYYHYRDVRLKYVQRSLLTGAVEGHDQFKRLLGTQVDWRFGHSRASSQQPDRRETRYEERWYYPGDVAHWVLAAAGTRQYGDLHDNGWGTTISAGVPYRLGQAGEGRVSVGYDFQTKERTNKYRSFAFYRNGTVDPEALAEQVFAPSTFDSSLSTAYVEETTDSLSNYTAHQRVTAMYLSVDVPLGRRARANVGVRNEHGYQDVQTTARYEPSQITAAGKLDNRDWLPSGNLTVAVTNAVNLRLAASHTLSRPDLTELSPTRSQEDYYGGYLTAGNEKLQRATIENYDVRVEAFPGISEVLAAGYFYKNLNQPIENVLRANTGEGLLLQPDNQQGGFIRGVEMEARVGLGRIWRGMNGLSVNTNLSLIDSRVKLKPMNVGSELGTTEHPLQGQADYVYNVALSYTVPKNNLDASVLLGSTGKRLYALGTIPLPDIYEQPLTTLDAALIWRARLAHVKLGARNLLDQQVRLLQGGRESSTYHSRSVFSVELSWGS